MARREELQALLARVKAATGKDVELNNALADAMGLSCDEEPVWTWPPDFTASIDAAVALVERCLPGDMGSFGLMVDRDSNTVAFIVGPNALAGFPLGQSERVEKPLSLPLAILSALLSALIKQEAQS